ncbi:ABC transporter permease [Psychrobacillus sp. OK032]|uniref:ABC transporter permease n=1 Tax=Psychrobacillus sp. OK032 TaxID=1884358 RepID=UPI0008CC1EAD|nr:ABC transporter permease [Psychrobacillus sp. OK032]SER79451.1 ABC-2 type transport system permease protein [Psychrobacillus sp. OK032]
MLNLIRNEWMKLWHKKSTWVMVALLIAMIIGLVAITKWIDSNTEIPAWEQSVTEELTIVKQQLAVPDLNDETKKSLEDQQMLLQYRLDEGVAPLSNKEFEGFMMDSYGMSSIITLLTVIVAAGIVASEFSQGTIKMLLARPVRRWKILTSKFLTVIAFALFLTVISYVVSLIMGMIFYEASGGSLLEIVNGQVTEVSYWLKSIWLNVLALGDVIIIASFAFAIGTVFRSSSLAIGIAIFLMFTGAQFAFFLRNYEIVKYILFSHTFTQIETGGSFIEGMSTPFSVFVLVGYFVFFLAISYWTFTKRDVTA